MCVRAAVDAELPVGTRMKVQGQAGVGTYLSFKRARRGGALLPFLACVFQSFAQEIDVCYFLNIMFSEKFLKFMTTGNLFPIEDSWVRVGSEYFSSEICP